MGQWSNLTRYWPWCPPHIACPHVPLWQPHWAWEENGPCASWGMVILLNFLLQYHSFVPNSLPSLIRICFSVTAAHVFPTPWMVLFHFISTSNISLHVFQAASHSASCQASVLTRCLGIIPLSWQVFEACPGLISSASLCVCFRPLNPEKAIWEKGTSKDLIHFISLA